MDNSLSKYPIMENLPTFVTDEIIKKLSCEDIIQLADASPKTFDIVFEFSMRNSNYESIGKKILISEARIKYDPKLILQIPNDEFDIHYMFEFANPGVFQYMIKSVCEKTLIVIGEYFSVRIEKFRVSMGTFIAGNYNYIREYKNIHEYDIYTLRKRYRIIVDEFLCNVSDEILISYAKYFMEKSNLREKNAHITNIFKLYFKLESIINNPRFEKEYDYFNVCTINYIKRIIMFDIRKAIGAICWKTYTSSIYQDDIINIYNWFEFANKSDVELIKRMEKMRSYIVNNIRDDTDHLLTLPPPIIKLDINRLTSINLLDDYFAVLEPLKLSNY